MIAKLMNVERRRYTQASGSSAYFRPVTADQLRPNAVAASCLDDQYIDKQTLLSQSIGFRQRYTKCVLDEFAKCLLSAEQIIVNRTYLQNTEVMQQIAPKADSAADTAIVKLIGDDAIVPYLYSDADPTFKASVDSGAMNGNAASAWNRVCERTEPLCLRLSWNDVVDQELRSTRLAAKFSSRLQLVAETSPPDILAQLTRQHSETDVHAFERYLKSVLLPIARDRPTRRELYERLILRDGTNIVDTEIDLLKPFACEIKQLIDLIYNANMAGALGLNNISPSSAISADLLSDSGLNPQSGRLCSPDLAAAVASLAVTMQNNNHAEQTVPLLGTISLDQVIEIRAHSSWRLYVRASENLRNVDISLSDEAFYNSVEQALGEALERSQALSSYLYQSHGALRQKRNRTRSLIAQVGSLCFGAAVGTVVGGEFPSTIAGSLAGNLAGGAVQNLLERPLRHIAMRIDPLGNTFASARLPELKLTGHHSTMQKFQRELEQMKISATAVDSRSLQSPTIEAEITTL